MSASTIISVIGTAVSLLGFIQSNFPEKENDGGSSLAFAVGLDTDGLSNAGGYLPDVRLFGENGEFLGAVYDPGHIQDGAAGQKVKVDQNDIANGRQVSTPVSPKQLIKKMDNF